MTLSRQTRWSVGSTIAAAMLACTPAHSAMMTIDDYLTMWGEQIKESAAFTLQEMKVGIEETKFEQKITIRNLDTVKRKAYWTALGCFPIVDGIATVCHSEELSAGASATGTFKKGTSQRVLQMRRIDKNDQACRAKVDVNGGGAVTDLKLAVGCSNGRDVEGAPNAPPPSTTVLTITSALDHPVTVIVGWNSCKGTYKTMQHVCATAVLQPGQRTSVSYIAAKALGRGAIENQQGLGLVSWTDDKKGSVPVSVDGRKNVIIPPNADRVQIY